MPKGRRDPESCLDVKVASNAVPEKKVKRNPEGKLPLGARKHEVEGSRSPSTRPAALPIRTGLNALLRHSSPPLTAPHSQITVCGSVLRSRRAAAPGIVGCAAVRQKTRDIGPPPRSPLPQHPLPTQLRETKLCEIPGEKKKKSG